MDKFDVTLQDDELMDEVELTANLIVAANKSPQALPSGEIDRILGVASDHVPTQPVGSAVPDTSVLG